MRTWNGFVCHSNKKLAPWRTAIKLAIQATARARPLFTEGAAVYAYMVFVLPRPKTVKRARPTGPPDCDKLIRACSDAIEASGVLVNDAQIVEIQANKLYGDNPRLKLYLKEIL